jgi:hypothetical protein
MYPDLLSLERPFENLFQHHDLREPHQGKRQTLRRLLVYTSWRAQELVLGAETKHALLK